MTEHETMTAARTAFIVACRDWLRTKPSDEARLVEFKVLYASYEIIRRENNQA